MDDRRALMAAIIANPEEDTPRLALADWLDEHGDRHDRARAEFIRCQIAAAAGGPDAKAAAKRASAIRSAQVRHWLGPLWELTERYKARAFTRGILTEVFASPGDFLKKPNHDAACERFPLLGVGRLVLIDTTARVDVLANSPALGWVAHVRWHDAKIEDDGFKALARSPHLERLTRLEIDKPRCTDKGLKALADSKGLSNLRALALIDGLWRGDFTAAGVRLILDSDRLPRLDELDLTGAHKSAVTHRTFFTYKSLSRLRVLKLGFQAQMKYLAKCPYFSNLEELHVADTTIADADAEALVANPVFDRLKVLKFTEMNPGDPPLSARAEQLLRDRFGDRLTFEYSCLCHRGD